MPPTKASWRQCTKPLLTGKSCGRAREKAFGPKPPPTPRNLDPGAPPPPQGLAIWSLNTCSLKPDDLIPLAHSFSDSVRWDALCIQEGVRHREEGVEVEEGFTIITGKRSHVGAPHLILAPRLGSRLRKWHLHTHYIIASFGTTPPVVIFTLYLPAHGSHGDVPFEQITQEFTQDIQNMQRQSPGSFVLGAADCNTQLKAMPGQVGPETGANERLGDEERADVLMHALAQLDLTAPSSYVNLGPTRTPWPNQSQHQKPSVIDYLFASPKLSCQIHTDNPPTPDTPTDHKPIGMTALAPYASRKDRRRQFEAQIAQGNFWGKRLPATWTPQTLTGMQQNLSTKRLTSLPEVAPILMEAAQTTNSAESARTITKRKLLEHIRRAQDPIVKKAYQIQLRQHRREQREKREKEKLLAWARGDNWDFSRQIKIPSRLRYPPTLNDNTDRGEWGNLLGAYLTDLYSSHPDEAEDVNNALLRIMTHAIRHARDPLICMPNNLRDIVKALPPNKAAGPDGVPSQLVKAMTFQNIKDLAELFTTLANDIDYRPQSRPDCWNNTLAMLIPKEASANTLDRHRAISLMSQIQKLYSKWLLSQMTPILDPIISEHQAGFRPNRQASEILHVISKLIELSIEWKQPLTIVRLDLKKAFDRVKQSAILNTLETSPLPPKIIFNAARELVGCKMSPAIYGCTPETPVELQQGTKQGAPESGLYFVATLNKYLAPVREEWDRRGEGCPIGPTMVHHLIFADDLLLLGPSPLRVKKMIDETQTHIKDAGLDINQAKTAYLTTHPASSHHLPGTNANQTGMKILGRTFTLQENTPQDMDIKIGIAWSKFNRLRHILKAETPLPHRLRIFKSCVGQALLWASETWHLTRRRLQRIRGI